MRRDLSCSTACSLGLRASRSPSCVVPMEPSPAPSSPSLRSQEDPAARCSGASASGARRSGPSTKTRPVPATGQGLELVGIVTQDDSLQGLKGKLWDGRQLPKILSFAVIIVQILFNCTATARTCYCVMMGADQCNISRQAFMARRSSLRLLIRAFALSEALMLAGLACYTLLCSLYLLLGRNPIAFVGKRCFALMALPRITSRFSWLMFLHMASMERLKSAALRNEFRCLMYCLGPRRRTFLPAFRDGKSESGCASSPDAGESATERTAPDLWSEALCRLLGLLLCLLGVMLALQALYGKVIMLSFPVTVLLQEWDLQQWMLFLSLVNQLSGMSMANEIELLRLLLCIFSNEHATWQIHQIEACSHRARYCGPELVKQVGRTRTVILLWTMNSLVLGKLVQVHQKLEQHSAGSPEMLERRDEYETLMHRRDVLVRNFLDAQKTLDAAIHGTPSKQQLQDLACIQTRSIEAMRLAAQMQECLWQGKRAEISSGHT